MNRLLLLLALTAACQKPAPPPAATPASAPADLIPAPAAARKPKLDVAASVVTVQCGDSSGAGFFVSEAQVLTRLHFTCSSDDALRVKLADDRTLLGKLRWKDETLDAALIEVQGGEGEPLPLGDAAAVTLSGLLPKAKLKDDAYSELARLHFVIEYADAVPSEGQPIVDEQQRVIAMAARVLDAHRGLALPLPVIVEAGARLAVPNSNWREIEDRAGPSAEAELAAARDALSHAVLASAVLDSDGKLFAQVVRRADASGSFSLVLGSCTVEVMPWAHEPFEANAALDLRARRLFTYFERTHLDSGLAMGLVQVDCPRAKAGLGVRVNSGQSFFEQALVGEVPRMLQPTQMLVHGAASLGSAGMPAPPRHASGESQWRERYREARKLIAELEHRKEEDQRHVDNVNRHGISNRSYPWRNAMDEQMKFEGARQRLAQVDEEIAHARTALDELDREAANAGIPMEWRH